jgi:uncharacterized protein
MQFILMAYDGTDSGALDRRMAVRQQHLDKIDQLRSRGEFIYGGAILDNAGKMIGSVVLYEFPDRTALDKCLETEPYILNGVWEKIEIHPFRLAKHN